MQTYQGDLRRLILDGRTPPLGVNELCRDGAKNDAYD
jgi:hypothetical protein